MNGRFHLIPGLAATEAEELLSLNLDSVGIAHELNPCVYGFYPDILIIGTKLLIELDGSYHDSPKQRQKDAVRQHILENSYNFKVLRFTNREVIRDCRGVLKAITDTLRKLG